MSGRPTKFDKRKAAQIIKTLKVSGTLEQAAQAAGVHVATLHAWKARGIEEKTGQFHEFHDLIQRTLSERDLGREKKLLRSKDWKATAWLMERTDPKRYAPRVFHHVDEELEAGVNALAEEFKDEPEILHRAITALTRSGGEAQDTGTHSLQEDSLGHPKQDSESAPADGVGSAGESPPPSTNPP